MDDDIFMLRERERDDDDDDDLKFWRGVQGYKIKGAFCIKIGTYGLGKFSYFENCWEGDMIRPFQCVAMFWKRNACGGSKC